MAQNLDEPQSILIERGSYITHFGYAGEDKTELSFRTPNTSVEAQFKHIFNDILKVDPAQYKIVIVKDVGAAQQVLRDEAHILFTKFHVIACAFINTQVGVILSWVNKGSNGVVIDIGYENTIVVPIMDLKAQMAYMTVIPLAGRAIEQLIISHLIQHGISKGFIENYREQLISYLMSDYFYFDSESEHDFERDFFLASLSASTLNTIIFLPSALINLEIPSIINCHLINQSSRSKLIIIHLL